MESCNDLQWIAFTEISVNGGMLWSDCHWRVSTLFAYGKRLTEMVLTGEGSGLMDIQSPLYILGAGAPADRVGTRTFHLAPPIRTDDSGSLALGPSASCDSGSLALGPSASCVIVCHRVTLAFRRVT